MTISNEALAKLKVETVHLKEASIRPPSRLSHRHMKEVPASSSVCLKDFAHFLVPPSGDQPHLDQCLV